MIKVILGCISKFKISLGCTRPQATVFNSEVLSLTRKHTVKYHISAIEALILLILPPVPLVRRELGHGTCAAGDEDLRSREKWPQLCPGARLPDCTTPGHHSSFSA